MYVKINSVQENSCTFIRAKMCDIWGYIFLGTQCYWQSFKLWLMLSWRGWKRLNVLFVSLSLLFGDYILNSHHLFGEFKRKLWQRNLLFEEKSCIWVLSLSFLYLLFLNFSNVCVSWCIFFTTFDLLWPEVVLFIWREPQSWTTKAHNLFQSKASCSLNHLHLCLMPKVILHHPQRS